MGFDNSGRRGESMKLHRILAVTCATSLAVAGVAGASSGEYWLHVRVDETHGGAKVSVNLPVALFERALPLIPEFDEARFEFNRHSRMELEDLRAIWQELRDSPDMTLVEVEDRGENVRVWKEAGYFHVRADEEYGDKVNVRLPMVVVDAFLAAEKLDLKAAIDALIASGGGELVTINDDREGDRVRVWIDRAPEAESGGGR
jgi:hypothetical protein